MDQHRRSRLAQVMEREGLDALVATTPENIYYATGFRSMIPGLFRGVEVYAVVTRRATALVVPFIDTAGIAAGEIVVDVVAAYGKFFFEYADDPGTIGRRIREWTKAPAASASDALVETLRSLGVARGSIGIDEGNLFPAAWRRLEEVLGGANVSAAYQHFRSARMVKSREEIAALEQAAHIAEAGIAAVHAMLKPGVTEIDAVRAYEAEIVRAGGTNYFAVIGFGDRAALGDTYPSSRSLKLGNLVRFDVGCLSGTYRSDIARTAVLGPPSPKQAAFYAALQAGEAAAIAAMKPGVPVSEVFDVAVKATREAGLPHYQRHHVGHGIGLEMYDPPTMTPDNATVIEAGMVFCVETPFYEQGWGGLQVEDMVEITPQGARLLTRSDRGLVVIA